MAEIMDKEIKPCKNGDGEPAMEKRDICRYCHNKNVREKQRERMNKNPLHKHNPDRQKIEKRNKEIYEKFQKMDKKGMKKTDIYNILMPIYGIHSSAIGTIIRKMRRAND